MVGDGMVPKSWEPVRQERAFGRRNMARAIATMILVSALASSCSLLNPPRHGAQIIADLQKQLPFTLVVPTYLPPGFLSYPAGIAGPGKGPGSENSVEVGFGYEHEKGSDRHIWIVEENFEYNFLPSRPTSIFIDIKGTKVLEEDTELDVLLGFRYAWNQGGVSVQVNVYGYGKDESRKVVESMIR